MEGPAALTRAGPFVFPGRGALNCHAMDDLQLLWIPIGLFLIVAAVATPFLLMQAFN
jgi:hypothetical protein